jgi:hypothetical protein
MYNLKHITLALFILLLAGCATKFLSNSLNGVQMGWSKGQLLQYFSKDVGVPPILRASQQQSNGQVVEIFTLPLIEPNYDTVNYWFVFKGGRLVQWGRPKDWQSVSGRYEISFNPEASVR